MSAELENNAIISEPTSSTIVQEVDMLSIISDVKEEVTSAIDFEVEDRKIDVNFPQFLSIWDDGVFVHLDLLSNKSEFMAFIDDLFSKGFFLKDINYTEFLNLYFENENYQWNQSHTIKIAKTIERLQEKRVLKLYKNFQVSKSEVEFLFDKYIFLDPEEKLEPYSFDEMVAILWGLWVKYWIKEDIIQKAISAVETTKVTIVQDVPPISWEDAKIEQVYSFVEKDFSPTQGEDGKINYTKVYNNIPQVDEWVEIFKKTPIKPGKDGRTMLWVAIPQPPLKDANLMMKRWEGTKIEEREGWYEVLVAELKGYLDLRIGKVSVTKNKKPHRADIDGKSGDIEIKPGNGDFTLLGKIVKWFTLKWNDIFITWDIEWKAISRWWNMQIKGWVYWGGYDTKWVLDGFIKNHDWNITFLSWVVCRWELNAPRWKIDIKNLTQLEFSNIVAQEIEWNEAVCSKIIGQSIKMKKLKKNSIVIGNNIEIEQIEEWSNCHIVIVMRGDIFTLKAEHKKLEDIIIQKGNIVLTRNVEITKLKELLKGLAFNYDDQKEFFNQVDAIKLKSDKMQEQIRELQLRKRTTPEMITQSDKLKRLAEILVKMKTIFMEISTTQAEIEKYKKAKDERQSKIDAFNVNPPTCNIASFPEWITISTVVLEDFDLDNKTDYLLNILMGENMTLTELSQAEIEYNKPYTFSL